MSVAFPSSVAVREKRYFYCLHIIIIITIIIIIIKFEKENRIFLIYNVNNYVLIIIIM